MKKEGRAGLHSSTHGLERHLDPEFRSRVKIFRQIGFVGEPGHFFTGAQTYSQGPRTEGSSSLVRGYSKRSWGHSHRNWQIPKCKAIWQEFEAWATAAPSSASGKARSAGSHTGCKGFLVSTEGKGSRLHFKQ